jgi:hypothetical protein
MSYKLIVAINYANANYYNNWLDIFPGLYIYGRSGNIYGTPARFIVIY